MSASVVSRPDSKSEGSLPGFYNSSVMPSPPILKAGAPANLILYIGSGDICCSFIVHNLLKKTNKTSIDKEINGSILQPLVSVSGRVKRKYAVNLIYGTSILSSLAHVPNELHHTRKIFSHESKKKKSCYKLITPMNSLGLIKRNCGKLPT